MATGSVRIVAEYSGSSIFGAPVYDPSLPRMWNRDSFLYDCCSSGFAGRVVGRVMDVGNEILQYSLYCNKWSMHSIIISSRRRLTATATHESLDYQRLAIDYALLSQLATSRLQNRHLPRQRPHLLYHKEIVQKRRPGYSSCDSPVYRVVLTILWSTISL